MAMFKIFALSEITKFSMTNYTHAIILKVIHLFLSWITTDSESKRQKLENLYIPIKHSLEFLWTHASDLNVLFPM